MPSLLSAALGAAGCLLALLGSPAGAVAAPAPSAPKAEDCLMCHSDHDLKRSTSSPGRPDSLFVDAAALKASAHGGLECVACHRTATAPHEALPRVRCADCHDKVRATLAEGAHGRAPAAGATAPACTSCHGVHDVTRAAVLSIDACAGCHARQVALYRESVHGRSRARGGSEAATCRSCHGAAHALRGRADPQAPTYHLNLPRTCAQCHADSELARRHNITVGNVYQLYMDSIHGRAVSKSGLLVAANCSDCHGAHEIQPRTEPTSRVFRANIPATCGGCHAGVRHDYAESIHGQAAAGGDARAPVCTDCHSAHQIRRTEAEPWQLEVIRECGTCHAESLKTYRDTFHGKVTALGITRVAKCADCHGSHRILPAADQRSTIAATNILATCRQCHTSATWKFTEFHPHADPSDRARFPKLYWTWLVMTTLLIGTFGFFGLHTALWLPRSLWERLRRRRRGAAP
jgi:cytochrome c3-like protein/doubled CXXCH motif protein